MKIAIAQSKFLAGKIAENISTHLRLIDQAAKLDADLIVFPELSLTAYEPELAESLAFEVKSENLNIFQERSDKHSISISVGMPTKAPKGINISMLIFQPNQERLVYSKRILHVDEFPYFVAGEHQPMLNIQGTNIAFGICYETLQRAHFLDAQQRGADIYIASVAKPDRGIDKAYLHFPSIAKEFQTPILMSNCVGFCDNFLSNGQSAAWNKEGGLISMLDNENEGLLLYDTKLEKTEIQQPKIELGQLKELESIFQIYQNARQDLKQKKVYQWINSYPSIRTIERDLQKGSLYVLKNVNKIIGAITLNEDQETEYQLINWQFDDAKVLVIHRLAVDPKHQGKGYAKILMGFAENFALNNDYSSVRLDTYSQNDRAIQFYERRGYITRGNVIFFGRDAPFHCMEKKISNEI